MKNEKSILLEIYRSYIQTAENISDKRLKSNSFYLTLCSTLVTISVAITESSIFSGFVFIIDIIGSVICAIWFINIMSYKCLNYAKYKVIHKLEETLPVKCFYDEWEILKHKKHKKLSDVEKYVPFVFILGFVFLLYTHIMLVFTT